MFEEFLYTLRRGGLKVSLTEWMSLMEALDKGLHRSSFTGFYHLCRCLLVKSEADFDAFDRCFLDYFQGVPAEEEVSQELLRWLDRPNALLGAYDEQQAELNESLSRLEIEALFQERKREQREQHNCGSYWVGTHGMSIFGNLGMSPAGLRVGGESRQRRAFRVAGERRYRDFRKDSTLDTRQLQVALRRLRQYSGLVDLPATEFDVDGTIRDTAEHAGALNIRYKKPRQNTVKVLLLMDSGGSMEYYDSLCSALFQAVNKSNHFKDLKIFYFHNCPYTRVYHEPTLDPNRASPVSWLLSNIPPEYKVIFVGDAQMHPYELLDPFPVQREGEPVSGLDCLRRIRDRFRHAVWLNPGERPAWGEEWTRTYDVIQDLFPMYPLTVEGLEQGVRKLLAR